MTHHHFGSPKPISQATITDGNSGVGLGFGTHRIPASMSAAPDRPEAVALRNFVPQQHTWLAAWAEASRPQFVHW